MSELKEIKFVVDEQYENEKGIFTVLSIKKNDMVIRWESGEEIQTTVELQTTIQARRQWEQLQREIKAAEAKKSPKSGKAGGNFTGFKSSDFKTSAARTNWRGRAQLGGAVFLKMTDSMYKFNSWAFSTKSEVHWQDVDKRKADKDGVAARFFVRLDASGLSYGFLVSRKADQDTSQSDWERFHAWIGEAGNKSLVQSLSETHQLALFDSKGAPKDKADPSDTHYELSCKMAKDDAIARKKAIAEDIADLFSALMPLYEAAVGA